MNVQTEKQFIKDVSRLPKAYRTKILNIVQLLQNTKIAQELSIIEKLYGFDFYYKIRVVYLRIGLKVIDNRITLITCQKRGDIYKHFP